MIIEQVEQRSDAWFAWRSTGISASDTPVILGLSPYKTQWRLWAEKTGKLEPDDLSNNPHVQRGIELEDVFRQHIEEKLDIDVLFPTCGASQENPLFRASLDGQDSDQIPHELKCPCEKQWTEVLLMQESSSAFKLYYPQVQHQLLVAGASHGYLHFGFQANNKEFESISFRIERDAKMIKRIIDEGTKFWNCIVSDTPPAKDLERDYFEPEGADLFEWKRLATKARSIEIRRQVLLEELESLDYERKEVQFSCEDMMGDYKTGDFHGLRVTRVKRQGKIALKRALKDLMPNVESDKLEAWLEQYRDKGTQYLRWTVNTSIEDIVAMPVTSLPVTSALSSDGLMNLGEDWIE